jgi:hypothetical protein
MYERVKRELKSGVRQALPIKNMDEMRMAEIQKGEYFTVEGQLAYVADVGEAFTTKYERKDSRLRVIYDNGTESDVLQRSLQRALHRDEAARLITNPTWGRCSQTNTTLTTLRAAPSTFCGASPTTRLS